MSLIIYTLNGCKVCTRRQAKHNALAAILVRDSIEVEGIMFGMIDGQRYHPKAEHDELCRKNASTYAAPVYILEIDGKDGPYTIKLPDFSENITPDGYAERVIEYVRQVS